MWRWVGTVVVALLGAFWLIGIDATESATGGDPGAAAALVAVTDAGFDPQHPAASFPADWVAVMGYTPTTGTGPAGTPILTKPAGDCSAPNGATQYDFDAVCKEHDLSYDVLRYAGAIGRPLPASARQVADDMFDRELHGRCVQQGVTGWDYVLCHSYAEGFAQVVKVNSWRQGYRPPGVETPWRWSALMAFVGALICLPLTLRRLRVLRHTMPWHPATMLPPAHLPAGFAALPLLHSDLTITSELVRRLLAGRRPWLFGQLLLPGRVVQPATRAAEEDKVRT